MFFQTKYVEHGWVMQRAALSQWKYMTSVCIDAVKTMIDKSSIDFHISVMSCWPVQGVACLLLTLLFRFIWEGSHNFIVKLGTS